MFKKLRKLFVMLTGCFSLIFSMVSCTPNNEYIVKLNLNELTLNVGEGHQLVVDSVSYNSIPVTSYVVTWSSSDETVATVTRNGYVSSVESGTCTITANVSVSGNLLVIASTCAVTVIDDEPVSITLNKTDTKLQIGKKLQLSAKVSHAVDKSVKWESDNGSVLVSDNGLVSTSESVEIGATATIKATSLEDSTASAQCFVTIVEKSIYDYEYTLMYYMAGSTLENEYSRALSSGASPHLISDDIKEILSVDIPDTVKVIIETGGTTKWGLSKSYIDGASSISSSSLQRWEVSNKKIKLVDTLTTNNMTTEASYESFLTWGMKDYGADQMGVVISGHGGGICGCAFDDNAGRTGAYLQVKDMVLATDNAVTEDGRGKLTWMGFDCCMMQCADIASSLSDYFEYMVASQESEVGEGWSHADYIQLLADDPSIDPTVLLPEIASSFVETSEEEWQCSQYNKCLQTLSVLDLSKMPTFTNEFNNYVTSTGNGSVEYSKYRAAFLNSYHEFGEDYYGLVDFADYIKNLKTQFPSVSTDALSNALSNLVIANKHCKRYKTGLPCGLNAFLPETSNKKSDLEPEYDEYTGSLVTKFTPYQEMVLNYGF